ncbi:hypothetical protein JZU46_01835 [bacterium]|nr:hypothetical protein [bacterium]
MHAELVKYAASEKANPKAIETKTELINQLNDYIEYTTRLYIEFREQAHTDYSSGFNAGYRKCQHELEPHTVIRSGEKELDRFNSLTRVKLDFPNLF